MHVEQAIFTSIRGSHRQGYHLVSRSRGIDESLSQRLTLWCPTHAALITEDPADCSLNYFPVGDGWVALTRTIYGGPEYSGRGGLQVVTLILLVQQAQLENYEGDPLRIIRLAQRLGHLQLPMACPHQLAALELPDRSAIGAYEAKPHTNISHFLLDRAARLLRDQQRLAVLGVDDRVIVLQLLLEQLTKRQRMGLSFTTGLKPSLHRPFSLHLLPVDNTEVRQHLAAQDVYCLTA